jgi:hypothetical protein
MVEAFLKAPVNQMPPDQVDRFMAVDPQTLPKKLRTPFRNRVVELEAVMKAFQAKKKGFVIMPYDTCDTAKKDESASTLLNAGYQEITDSEEAYLIRQTKCTEMDQRCDFTLRTVDEPPTKTKKGQRRYFLYCHMSCDPLMILIGFERKHINDRGTDFFGIPSYPNCVH